MSEIQLNKSEIEVLESASKYSIMPIVTPGKGANTKIKYHNEAKQRLLDDGLLVPAVKNRISITADGAKALNKALESSK